MTANSFSHASTQQTRLQATAGVFQEDARAMTRTVSTVLLIGPLFFVAFQVS